MCTRVMGDGSCRIIIIPSPDGDRSRVYYNRAWRDWHSSGKGGQFRECIDCHSFDDEVVNELDLMPSE